MPVIVPRGPKPQVDPELNAIVQVLDRYAADHPPASVEVYRHGRYVVRIRIVSEVFRGRSLTERHRSVWPYLEPLPEEILSDVTTLFLLTPEERETSIASLDFDDPIPARL